MAGILDKPIWSADGLTLSNVLLPVTNLYATYNVTTEWYDGTPMDDSKLDTDLVYVKFEDKYLLRNMEYGQVLQKDTMPDMRALSTEEILLLRLGVYKHVQLNGYDVVESTPSPINYVLSNTTSVDDGGSVIEAGGVKLEHKFGSNETSVKHFGVSNTSDPLFNTIQINRCLELCRNVIIDNDLSIYVAETEIIPTYRDIVENVIKIPNHTILTINGNIELENRDTVVYGIISATNVKNVFIQGFGSIIGNLINNTSTVGEHGHGIRIYDCQDVKVMGSLKINHCFGDGVYLSGGRRDETDILNDNIDFFNVTFHQNRRQGMSFVKASNVIVDKCKIIETGKIKGTNPMCGIDIEPEWHRSVTDVEIKNCYFKNNENSSILLITLKDTTEINRVNINNNYFYHDIAIPKNGDGSYNMDGVELRYVLSVRKSSPNLSSIIENVKICNNYILCGQRAQRGVNVTNNIKTVDISDNNIIHNVEAGLINLYETRGINTATVINCRINKNYVSQFTKGFYSESSASRDFKVTENTFTGQYLRGIELLNLSNSVITNNDIDNSEIGIYCAGVKRTRIENNNINTMLKNAIMCYYNNSFLNISDNTITECVINQTGLDIERSVIGVLSAVGGENKSVIINNNTIDQTLFPNVFRYIYIPNATSLRCQISDNVLSDENGLITNNSTGGIIKKFKAGTNVFGSVKKANFSENSAASPSSSYSQSQIQGILDELRDVKAKIIQAEIMNNI